MSNQFNAFWENFENKNFAQAQAQLDKLSANDKQAVLAELFQKTAHQQTPLLVSVLRRELRDEKSFDDFYQSWLPSSEMTNTVQSYGQTYQQHFPLPVRVINATSINNPKEIISIGLTWVSNEEEEKGLWEHLAKAANGEDADNEARHDKVDEVAEGELIGLFKVETDDNLGTPF